MKKMLFFILLMIPGTLWAGDSITVPWEEFKTLYQESIERNILKNVKKEESPAVYSLEEAVYKIRINKKDAEVDLMLSGRKISGKPEKIPIFKKDVIIDEIKQVTGGFLLQDKDNHIVFLPEDSDEKRDFQIHLTFSIPAHEDSKSCIVSFSTPKVLKNSLLLQLSPDTSLVEHPGIRKPDGMYHFSAGPAVTIRFSDKKEFSAASVTEIDIFSRIKVQARQAIVTTSFLPIQPLPSTLVLEVSEDATYISSSLKSSWIKKLGKNRYQLSLPSGLEDIFSMKFAHDELETKGTFSFSLPVIKKNNGKQGCFTLEQPDDGQVILNSNKLVSGIPVSGLNTRMIDVAGIDRSFMKIPPMENLNLRLKRFQAVSTPPIVLDSISFFTAFEDNGSVLSVLIMDIPPEAGARLSLNALSDTDIWYLKVNGKKSKVYGNQNDKGVGSLNNKWIIPLAKGKTSHVELAYFRQGEKPGLYGRLETALPEIGLPSRSVRVGVALPERIQLLSLEGPVSPIQECTWETPEEFIGKPYYFFRSFYKGEEMKIAVSYKEPVK